MEDFERALSELVASRTDDEEAAAARRLAQLARDRRVALELVARDLTSGRTVAIADLLSHRGGPLSIELSVDSRPRISRQWRPRQAANVLLLLGE